MLQSLKKFLAPPLTFGAAYPIFYKHQVDRGLRPWTLCHWRNFGNRLNAHMSDRVINRMTRQDFISLESTLGPDFMDRLRVIVRWAHAEDLIDANPMPSAKAPPLKDHQPPAFLTPSEAQRYYAAMTDSYKPALALAMFAGLRPMEVCRMEWSSINVAERRLRVEARMTKVRRPRLVEEIPTIVWAQLALFEKREGQLVPGKTDFSKYENWQHAKQTAARKSLVKLKPNVFRHSFATYFVALTGSTDRAAKILGHTKLDILARHYDGVATKADAEQYFHPKPILLLPEPGQTTATSLCRLMSS